mmetsp:Transcript_16720/g.25158  ORF Transcript_16720/g.25158 Transcript_16720/m.25158 type:complete len:286 (-) Transcript_16720:14-871(-)
MIARFGKSVCDTRKTLVMAILPLSFILILLEAMEDPSSCILRESRVLGVSHSIKKYYSRRYEIFHRYDEGILLDDVGFYSTTPQKLAEHHARRCNSSLVVDAFCGCGGNTIAFARAGATVTAVDIDKSKIEMMMHNSRIYGIPSGRIRGIHGDFLHLAKFGQLRGNVIFMSPPWGGPKYLQSNNGVFDPTKSLKDIQVSIERLISIASTCTVKTLGETHKNPNDVQGCGVAVFLPKNTDVSRLRKIVPENQTWELEKNVCSGKLVGFTLYTGGLVRDDAPLCTYQ